MTRRTYGPKYEATKNLSKVEIAKLIRQDIKAAVKDGRLPKGKYSVRTHLYAGGGSIDVNVIGVSIPLFNPDRIQLEIDEPYRSHSEFICPIHTPEAKGMISTLEAIRDAYNYDGSDSMTDYFDVRYYGSVSIDWRLACDERAKIAVLLQKAA